MIAVRWIDARALRLLQEQSIAQHGGVPGLRDAGLLDSALARPQNLLAYQEEADLAALAAAYAYGIVRNHPFLDGNKRAAFLGVGLFLALNGHRLVVEQAEATIVMLDLAAGELEEEAFAAWVREHAAQREPLAGPEPTAGRQG